MRTTALLFLFGIFPAFLSSARAADPKRHMHDSWVDKVDPDYKFASPAAYEDWNDRKFGVRIHFGIYSTLGVDASWPLSHEDGAFKKLYLTQYQVFNPTDFNADQWADDAQRWGFRYFVITTKHHDGFSMFDTQTTTQAYRRIPGAQTKGGLAQSIETVNLHFSIRDTLFQRDIVQELVTAFRNRNMGVGLYYSHIDWNDPNFRWDPSNVHHHEAEKYSKETNPKDWKAFIQRETEQVRELCTRYGPIQQIDFDGGWPQSAQRDLVEVVKLARRLQPDALFRNRGVGPYGDFSTPEHWVPAGPDDPRIKSNKAWQAIEHLHSDWAWTPNATYKSKEWVLDTLIDTTSMGGNFMVGIAPMPNGKFHPEITSRLEWVGQWLKVNGEAIYATRPLSLEKASQEKQKAFEADHKNVRFTRSKDGKYVYAICLTWPGERLTLKSLHAKEGSQVLLLGSDQPLEWRSGADDDLAIEIPKQLQDPANRPCPHAWAFRIEQQATGGPGSRVKSS